MEEIHESSLCLKIVRVVSHANLKLKESFGHSTKKQFANFNKNDGI